MTCNQRKDESMGNCGPRDEKTVGQLLNSWQNGISRYKGTSNFQLQLCKKQWSDRKRNEMWWELFLKWLILNEWKQSQAHYEWCFPPKTKSLANTRQAAITGNMLKFSVQCWKDRHTMVHDASLEEQNKIERQKLEADAQWIYNKPLTLAACFPSAEDLPLDTWLSFSTQHLQIWVQQIQCRVELLEHTNISD